MTGPGDERAHDGSGSFRDVLDVQVMEESIVLGLRIVRTPAQHTARMTGVVLSEDERVAEVAADVEGGLRSWDEVVAGPVRLDTNEPLKSWSVSVEAPEVRIALALRALTGPADLAQPATAAIGRGAALHRYTQLCAATGSVELAGRSREIEGIALRTHRWGPAADSGRARFVTAASAEGTLLMVAALRPPGTEAHGEELVGGQTLRAEEDQDMEPLPFETVRLSTVFDQRGLPVKAGAELFRPGEELPSRLAGAALAAVPDPTDDGGSLTLFRFGLDGVPALGSYEIEART